MSHTFGPVRIENIRRDRQLYTSAEVTGDIRVGAGHSESSDTHWTIGAGSADSPYFGYFTFESEALQTQHAMLWGGDGEYVGCKPYDEKPQDDPSSYWELVAFKDGWRFVNFKSKKALFTTAKEGHGDYCGLIADEFDDQAWKFVPEEGCGPNATGGDGAGVLAPDGDVFAWRAAVAKQIEDSVVPKTTHGFRTWTLAFDAGGQARSDKQGAALRNRLAEQMKQGGQHLFVFVHGVDTSFGPFEGYLERMAELYRDYQLDKTGHIKQDNISVLGVNWQSQDMGGMLSSLLKPGEQMPAQRLAQKGLSSLLNDIAAQAPDVTIHLVGHSMGSQVLLYLLPQLAASTRVGSMMFLQGFAPSSAFEAPSGKATRFSTGAADFISASLFENTLFSLTKSSPKVDFWFIDIDADRDNRTFWHNLTRALLTQAVKETSFHSHIGKVKGPILATTTPTLWGDYQVGSAELSFYAPAGVLGSRGFVGPDVADLAIHDLVEDVAEGGAKQYNFKQAGKAFFNLNAGPYITDHDDFSNRAVAFAHMRAAGLIPDETRAPLPAKAPAKASFSSATWMGDTWDTIGSRTLMTVCLPGSHDAGVGVVSGIDLPRKDAIEKFVAKLIKDNAAKLKGMNADLAASVIEGPIKLLTTTGLAMAPSIISRLSQTQTMPLGDQLRHGCRYFDLRPAWTPAGYFLAHRQATSDFGMIGCTGEQLETALLNIAAFASMPAHQREVIVLNFSHAMGPVSEGLTTAENRQLFDLIRSTLGERMVRNDDPHIRLDATPLSRLVEGGRNVICLFEPSLYDKAVFPDVRDGFTTSGKQGVFWWRPVDENATGAPDARKAPAPCNFLIYDQYANTRNPAWMVEHQRAAFNKRMALRTAATNATREVFVLSWTLTLMNDQAAAKNVAMMDMRSILDHAGEVNRTLAPSMENWIRRGEISGRKRPNIVYVDAYNKDVLEAVTMINAVPLD